MELETRRIEARLERGDPYWPAQLALAAAVALNLVLHDQITLGPTWLLPSIEAALLLGFVALAPRRATEHSRRRRQLSLVVIGTVSFANIVALFLLARYLIDGGHVAGRTLILAGVVLWGTNVLLFGVWYWEMDRGGPVARYLDPDGFADLQFPQMENPQLAPKGWRPGFGDYLYTSLTNAMAFSPTDTMPLTLTAKAVMGVQSASALLTLGLVIARAVNILG